MFHGEKYLITILIKQHVEAFTTTTWDTFTVIIMYVCVYATVYVYMYVGVCLYVCVKLHNQCWKNIYLSFAKCIHHYINFKTNLFKPMYYLLSYIKSLYSSSIVIYVYNFRDLCQFGGVSVWWCVPV